MPNVSFLEKLRNLKEGDKITLFVDGVNEGKDIKKVLCRFIELKEYKDGCTVFVKERYAKTTVYGYRIGQKDSTVLEAKDVEYGW